MYVDSDGPPKFAMPPVESGESVLSAVLAFIEQVPPGRDDGPQLVMVRCAVKLAQAIDADAPGLPALVGKLSDVMAHIADSQDEDGVDDIRARMHQRRMTLMEEAG